MKRKLYSISELINENMSLKKKLEKIENKNLISIINLLKLIRDNPKNLDLDRVILGFEENLEWKNLI